MWLRAMCIMRSNILIIVWINAPIGQKKREMTKKYLNI